jgi:hypothetical protein
LFSIGKPAKAKVLLAKLELLYNILGKSMGIPFFRKKSPEPKFGF